MTGFDRRLRDLLEKVRARAEQEGLQWRKADKDVYAFRAGTYVITVAKDRDPLLAIYDEHGEELEAIDRIDLEGRNGPDGRPLADVKARIWRLARRGAGVSAAPMDKVLDWLDERDDDSAAPQDGASVTLTAQPERRDSELSPQAPQAHHPVETGAVQAIAAQSAPAAPPPAAPEPERREDVRNGANGASHSGPRPPWAQ